MTSGAIGKLEADGIADRLIGLTLREGTASHPWPRSPDLLGGNRATRNLADAIHYLCMLHGRLPGVIDLAAERSGGETVSDWIGKAVDGFAAERAYLARLTVAAGPIPSTPGQAECEAAVVGQRHAIEMLAQSDRKGCALGASIALVLEWRAMRAILDFSAQRFGVEAPPLSLPSEAATVEAATLASSNAPAGIERAMWFGAQQLLVQHGGLWELLQSRAAARAAH